MATYRVQPAKPVAVMGAIFGLAILIFGIVSVSRSGHGGGFIWIWVIAGLAIISFNLWAAFSKRGSVQTITSDDPNPPTRLGQNITRE